MCLFRYAQNSVYSLTYNYIYVEINSDVRKLCFTIIVEINRLR
jgi:hypothetical protein